MMLEVGDIITLETNNKDYLVVTDTVYNNTDYYVLMTIEKPAEAVIAKLDKSEDGDSIIVTITDDAEIDGVMKSIASKSE